MNCLDKLDELISDPLFQMNLLLWATYPLPKEFSISPVLNDVGFEVYSIAELLPLPPNILLSLKQSSLLYKERTRPDVILARSQDKRFALVECKASSFSAKSSTSSQARTLMIICGSQLSKILGGELIEDKAAIFMLPKKQLLAMSKTCEELKRELSLQQIDYGECIYLGLERSGYELRIVANNKSKEFLCLPKKDNVIAQIEEDNDPRPLYIIPFDPDCVQTQEEAKYCKRVLFERILSHILKLAGITRPPASVKFSVDDLLNEATFGLFDRWENKDVIKHLRSVVRKLVGNMVKETEKLPNVFFYLRQNEWEIKLLDLLTQEKFCDTLSKFSCETLKIEDDMQEELPLSS